jgi:hypothetical protein
MVASLEVHEPAHGGYQAESLGEGEPVASWLVAL